MSITSIEAVILRAIGESEFAGRLLANFKEAVSEYKLGELELQAVESFVGNLKVAKASEKDKVLFINTSKNMWF